MMTPRLINPLRSNQRQRGAALLIALLILVLGLVTLLTLRGGQKAPELAADRQTALALAQAKEALLGRSAADAGAISTPGRLLCPDIANQGNTAGGIVSGHCYVPAGIPANAGRVPWKTLGAGESGDGSRERLWYVVVGEFINNHAPLNTTTVPAGNPLITITGSQSMNRVAAVLIAPGVPLQGQSRDTVENQNILINYVESYVNGTTINTAIPSNSYNDRILTITAQELFNVATRRVARELANTALPPYTPSADPMQPLGSLSKPAIWTDNDWDTAVDITNTSVTATTITLKFQNCATVYTITGVGIVMRNGQSC